MQANGSAVPRSDTVPTPENISPVKPKRTPPKSPKRVSFDLSHKTRDRFSVSPVSVNNNVLETVDRNGGLTDEPIKLLITESISPLNTGVVQQTQVNLHKSSDEFKGDADKSSDKSVGSSKTNIGECDTGQIQIDNEICSIGAAGGKSETSKPSISISERLRKEFVKTASPTRINPTSERLRQEFVKPNLNSEISNNSWPTRNPETPSSPKLTSPLGTSLRKEFTKTASPTRLSSTSERLRQEFVKPNLNSDTSNRAWPTRNSQTPGSPKLTSPLGSPNPDLQNRLSESQSKIAKLQQSLPTKLSEATVESLKNKYSPASFGYPKNFPKSPTENTKIPTIASKIARPVVVKPVIEKDTSKSTNSVIEKDTSKSTNSVIDKDTSKSTNSVIEKDISKSTNPVKTTDSKPDTSLDNTTVILKNDTSIPTQIEKRRTFRSELYIEPNSTTDEQIKPATENIDKESDLQVIASNTIKSKLVSSVIYPDENSNQINSSESNNEVAPTQKPVDTVSLAEHTGDTSSSDTITESEDSQNFKFRKSESDTLNLSEADFEKISDTSDTLSGEVFVEDEIQLTKEMEEPKKKPQKKRSNSFKRIFGFGSKDKKKNEEAKVVLKTNSNGTKKPDSAFADNAQNEANAFDRRSSQRHTISGHSSARDWECRAGGPKENVACESYYSNTNAASRYQPQYQQEQFSYINSRKNSSLPANATRQHVVTHSVQSSRTEDSLNRIQYELYLAQQTNQQLNSNIVMQQRSTDEYVCMDSNDKSNRTDLTQPGFINAHSIDKYIDTTSSSSISTLDSENKNVIYENTPKSNSRPSKIPNNSNTKIPVVSNSLDKSLKKNSPASSISEKCYERPKFADSPEIFTTTPRRSQGPQLIKPKAVIPITTERALPNPYRMIRDSHSKLGENLYGNLPALSSPSPLDTNLNSSEKQYLKKEPVYGKPTPPRAIESSNYSNLPKIQTQKAVVVEDDYGTVFDCITPVAAKLVVSQPQIIQGGKNQEKRSRSISPSQKQRATNLSSSSFSHKTRPPANQMSPTSPVRKELESTKLHLPSKRETLKPRLKSPIEDRRNLNKKPDQIKSEILSHQNLEIEIDYPDNNLNDVQIRKETPEKFMFPPNDAVPTSSKRNSNIKRSVHVSPNRPKSFTHSTPKGSDCPSPGSRTPVPGRSDSPASISSSLSLSSLSNKSRQPVTSEDLKDLKNTEVYFWEQTINQNVAKKDDVTPDQSPQQVLTQATIHQPKSSPVRLQPSPLNIQRASVPLDQQSPSKIPLSPQKQQNLQNVEAFYWQQIKKLKEKEEQEIYNQHVQILARQNSNQPNVDYANQHRSRSMNSPQRGAQRRSASLPRDVTPASLNPRPNTDLYGYSRTGKQYPIPEGMIVDGKLLVNKTLHQPQQSSDYGVVRHSLPTQNSSFVRGSPQRSTVGPISTQKRSQAAPVNELIYENYFPGVELRHQARSVSQGYAPIFKRGSLTPTPIAPQEVSPQTNKKVSFSSAQSDDNQVWPTKNGFTQSPPTRRVDRKAESMDDEVFLSNSEQNRNMFRNPNMNYNVSKEHMYVTSKLPPTHPNETTYAQNQREAIYGRAGGKQITVTNKVCDMYGQIHEVPGSPQSQKIYGNVQKTGVIYGQLKANPIPGSPLANREQFLNRSDPSFVRGTRLTSSFNDMPLQAPQRPLPPIPISNSPLLRMLKRNPQVVSESESGSEAGEVQRILAQKERRRQVEEEWNSDSKSGRSQSGGDSGGRGGDGDGEVRGSRARSGRRDDPRRHTLSSTDPHYPGMSVQGGPLSRTMDLEMPMPRGYPPPSSAMLFDDDPGIMSEVETSSTGFRRGGKQRSSLPVVRTPSKTLERPLGLVFLQYRNETKRALLPNEITSIDTVKALFVRSFPKQLTMEYLDSPLVKIYIHDSSKDMFYELEDLRSHLRDIRDRSVLRLFESADVSGGLPGPGTGISGGVGHFEDQSYFSEPEFDSEYQHQHIHKSKTSGAKGAPPYYMGSTTLPRGGPLLRAYSPAIGGPIPADRLKSLPAGVPPKPLRSYACGRGVGFSVRGPERANAYHSQADLRISSDNPVISMPDRIHTDGYMSSPERGSRGQYEDPYYSQYAARSGSITPVIDEEASDTELLDESYSLYGVKLPPPGGPRAVPAPRTQFPSAPTAVPYDATRLLPRLRVENMERQLANLTGLVQKALHQTPSAAREFLQVPGGRESYRADKSVSFEKSVSFSDEPPDMNSPKQHSPQHTERDRLKPAPPPKPASLSPAQYDNSRHIYRDLQLTPEMYNQLRGLQKKAKDLRTEVRNLRRLSQAQAHSVRETIRDTFIKIRAMLLASGEQVWQAGIDQEKVRLSREEDVYKQEMLRLEKDLTELESTVEELRGNVINRKTRVNMSDVENMALVLSKSSKTVADLKLRFPGLQDAMKSLLTSEMDKVVREEKFLKEEPERLENALRRCKKLTGTLVTLKRLASVQEQRLPNSTSDGRLSPTLIETPPITPPSAQHSKPPAVPSARNVMGQSLIGGDSTSGSSCDSSQRPENALDALLDELQTFSKPHPTNATSAPSTVTTQLPQAASYKIGTPSMGEIGRKGSMDSATLLPVQNLTVSTATGSLRRLHSYPSGSDTDNSPPIQPLQRGSSANKPPIPERNAELLQHLASGRRVPPPPPPRTSSKSPLASPTSPSLPPRSATNQSDKPLSQFEAATQNLGLGTLRRNVPGRSSLKEKSQTLPRNIGSNLQVQVNSDEPEPKMNPMSTSNSSSCESVNSQEGAKKGSRKEELEQRHQELLKKQKALQEQYARLQQLQRGNNTLTVVPPAPDLILKKTGSESNLLQKMGLQMAAPQQMSGSLTHLANSSLSTVQQSNNNGQANIAAGEVLTVNATGNNTTTAKVYETDIL